MDIKTELKIIKSYKDPNMSLLDVGLKFNVAKSTVYKILVKHNIKRKRTGINIKVNSIVNLKYNGNSKLLNLWDNGFSSKYISKELNIDRLAVAIHICKHRPYSRRIHNLNKRIIRSRKYSYKELKLLILYSKKKGKCDICKKYGLIVVDHNHSTGKVRGMLCYKCNIGIGALGDTYSKLKLALNYLKENP
mgnify:CR=1 FL=1